jgi:hypothetical protein
VYRLRHKAYISAAMLIDVVLCVTGPALADTLS